MVYEVRVKRVVEKYLAKIPTADHDRILAKIDDLEGDPRPDGCKKLKRGMGFGVRVGDYRIVYTVDDDERLVRVYRVGDRKDVYR